MRETIAEYQSVAAVLFFAGMLIAWLIAMFDPWIGIGFGVMVAIVAVTLAIAASTRIRS